MNPAQRDIIDLEAVAAFAPTDLAGLALWLDASDASTISLDVSNNVSQWNDKSGNARHAAQANALLRPAWGTQTQNGKNLIVTDAAGATRLVTGSAASSGFFGTNRNTGTQFRVFKNVGGTLPGGWHRADTAFLDTVIWRTNQFHLFLHGSYNDTANTVFGTNWFTANMSLYVASFDIAGQQVALRRDKAAFVTLNLASNAAFNSTNMTWQNNWDASAATIYEAEMIHYNRLLTASEISQVEDYLSAKWGL